MYRDLDKDSIIASLQEEIKTLKEAGGRKDKPYWGVKVLSVSINEDNKDCPYQILIEFQGGSRLTLNMLEENLKMLGNPTAGSILNVFLFPPKYFTNAGFHKE